MATQLSVETISTIIHNQIPVITTELLAHLYAVDANNIQQNYKRNTDHFIEGKHFFKAIGDELKSLQLTMSQLQISAKTRALILWTERGAARHAKMLETDKAWEVFEKLEDCYFNQRQQDLFDTDSAINVTIPKRRALADLLPKQTTSDY